MSIVAGGEAIPPRAYWRARQGRAFINVFPCSVEPRSNSHFLGCDAHRCKSDPLGLRKSRGGWRTRVFVRLLAVLQSFDQEIPSKSASGRLVSPLQLKDLADALIFFL